MLVILVVKFFDFIAGTFILTSGGAGDQASLNVTKNPVSYE